MATTQNTYTGNGSNKLFSITFPYLETSDIDVYLNNVLQTITTQYSFANATTIEFVTAPPNGAAVKIDRTTDDSELSATFFPGSSIKAADLNDNFDQTLYVVQEINNKAVKLDDPLYVNKTYIDAADATKVNKSGDTMTGNLAMSGNRVTGLGTPSSDADSATKLYVDQRYGELGVPGLTRWRKTATAGQTVFSGVGDDGNTLAYSASRESVFVNGSYQQRNVDYTANNGTSITITPALLVGDVVDVHCVNNAAGVATDQASGVYFTQSGSGALVRTVDSKLKDVVSVKDFGAVGNGVVDDTAAIQAALTKAGVTRSAVYVPSAASVYIITDVLTVPAGVTVYGDGYGSFIQQTTLNKDVFILGHNTTIRDLRLKVLDGNNGAFVNCIYADSIDNPTILNNWLEPGDLGGCGVQVRGCRQVTIKGNRIYGGKWTSGANYAASAADILFYSGTASTRHVIDGNYCLSNNSQGIFVDALGYESEVIVSNNVCVTLDPATCTEGGSWALAASGGTRRHGMIIGYNSSSVSGPRTIVNGNICANTKWTGIYKQGTSSGPVLITNNLCNLNGYEIGNALSGGIYVNQSGMELVANNTISNFQNTSAGAGGITMNASPRPTTPSTIIGNKVINSLGNGITLTTFAALSNVVNNELSGNVGADIYWAASAGDAAVGGHTIKGNNIVRTSGNNVPAIFISPQASTKHTIIEGNTIKGFDNANLDPNNAGIRTQAAANEYHRIVGNSISNFYYGVNNANYWTLSTRFANVVYEGNVITDCTVGFAINATGGTVTVPLVDNRFINVPTRTNAPIGTAAGRIVQRDGERFVWETTAAPTVGTWAVGDRSVNTTPAVGQPKAWSCTVAGSPGTWVSEGNL